MAARYQYGTLTRRERKKGPDVWQFRYAENGRLKSILIGTVQKLPTKADAERAVEHLRMKINAQVPEAQFHAVTVGGLIDRYVNEEIPQRYSTKVSYLAYLNGHIRPKWGEAFLQNVKPMAVEEWLRSMALSPKSKSHIRGLFHLIFQCARRWEMMDKNPIELVRQSSKRLKIPRVLTPEEFRALLGELKEPYKTMVMVSGCLGLRASEVMGLRWGDFDWLSSTVLIQRSSVHGKVSDTKTEASRKPVPLNPDLATALLRLYSGAAYKTNEDYVFASAKGGPRHQDTILKDHIKPAALRAKVGLVGWHTFRHTYATMLASMGTNLAVQKELLRHADISTTMNVYTQAVTQDKRDAAIQIGKVMLGTA